MDAEPNSALSRIQGCLIRLAVGVEGAQELEALAESLHGTFVGQKVRLGRPPE